MPEDAGSQRVKAQSMQEAGVAMSAMGWPVQPGNERLELPLRFVGKAIAFHRSDNLPSSLKDHALSVV